MIRNSKPIRVLMLAFPGPDAGSLFGHVEILRYASHFAAQNPNSCSAAYEIEVVSAGKEKTLVEGEGIRLEADKTFRDVKGRFDTLMVLSISDDLIDEDFPELTRWIAEVAPNTRRIVGICTGGIVIARAGLLSGRRATTHWAYADHFSRRFPDISVNSDSIYIQEGKVYTSAGAMASMDLTLALVEEDFGPELARTVARFLVIFLKRPGGQSQFSAQLQSQFAQREPIRELQGWIFDHLDADLSVDALADRTGMSPRNFRRVFAHEVGVTPAKYVEQARVEGARRMLEETSEGTETIAVACGFSSAEQMRLAFTRSIGIAPSSYRDRFATSIHAESD